MRRSLFLFLLTLSFELSAQVSTFGGITENVEAFMGNSWACNEADKAELGAVDSCIENFKVVNLQDAKDFDHLTESLIFLEAARKTHQLSICQTKLHNEFEGNATVRADLLKNSFSQFTQLSSAIKNKLAEQAQSVQDVRAVRSTMNFSEDRMSGMALTNAKRLEAANLKLARKQEEVVALVSQIPMGNRPLMKEKLLQLYSQKALPTESEFRTAYSQTMGQLKGEAVKAKTFFDGLKGKGSELYEINADLKKSLVRSGQVENTVRALNMEERLAHGFSCRARARYVSGPQTLKIAEVPFYFMGTYGLARLSLRVGLAAIRTASAGALIGLNTLQWMRVAESVRESCVPQEFLAGALNEGCTAESEVSGIYQEAFSAQCLSGASLGVAQLALTGAVRIWSRVPVEVSLKSKGITVSNYQKFFDPKNPVPLSDDERLFLFKHYSGLKTLSAQEQKTLLDLHRKGAGYGLYTPAELKTKADGIKSVLLSRGIKDPKEVKRIIDVTLRQGVLGKIPDEHIALTSKLYNGNITSIKKFSENSNSHSVYVVQIEGKNPLTGKVEVEEAIFKPRPLGDADGYNRTPMEYIAYELNQKLRMDYVPPTAYRKNLHLEIDGQVFTEGAVIHKVPGFKAIEDILPARTYTTNNEAILSDHRVLSVLMHNPDGHSKNLGVGTHWVGGGEKPTFIDFGASFRKGTDVSMTHYPSYGNSAPVTKIRRSTLDALKGLKSEDFKGSVDAHLIDQSEINQMLSRRDGIVRYFEELMKKSDTAIIND